LRVLRVKGLALAGVDGAGACRQGGLSQGGAHGGGNSIRNSCGEVGAAFESDAVGDVVGGRQLGGVGNEVVLVERPVRDAAF
jgi:hypothetical protein